MGTWDATILGNDTSAEVYEIFFEHYNCGAAVATINALIVAHFDTSLSMEEDKHNVLFALALASWEVGALSETLFADVCEAENSQVALDAYRSLGADPPMLRKRAQIIKKLVQKLSVPRPSPRKRRKPPVQLKTKFVSGACLAFHRSATQYGGVIIIGCEFFARRGSMYLAATSIAQPTAPTFRDFEKSKLHGFVWEEVSGQAARYASPNGSTGRIHTRDLDYSGSTARAAFFERAERFFVVVGHFPPFTQILTGATFSTLGRGDAALAKVLVNLRDGEKEEISREPLDKLAILLTTRRR